MNKIRLPTKIDSRDIHEILPVSRSDGVCLSSINNVNKLLKNGDVNLIEIETLIRQRLKYFANYNFFHSTSPSFLHKRPFYTYTLPYTIINEDKEVNYNSNGCLIGLTNEFNNNIMNPIYPQSPLYSGAVGSILTGCSNISYIFNSKMPINLLSSLAGIVGIKYNKKNCGVFMRHVKDYLYLKQNINRKYNKEQEETIYEVESNVKKIAYTLNSNNDTHQLTSTDENKLQKIIKDSFETVVKRLSSTLKINIDRVDTCNSINYDFVISPCSNSFMFEYSSVPISIDINNLYISIPYHNHYYIYNNELVEVPLSLTITKNNNKNIDDLVFFALKCEDEIQYNKYLYWNDLSYSKFTGRHRKKLINITKSLNITVEKLKSLICINSTDYEFKVINIYFNNIKLDNDFTLHYYKLTLDDIIEIEMPQVLSILHCID